MTNQTVQAHTKYPKPVGGKRMLLWLLTAIAIASALLSPGPFLGR